MALVVFDRVQETSSTTGTGTLTLTGAVPGYQSFAVVGNGNSTFYCIVNNTDWEVGIGTYTASGTTLSRDTILSNSLGTTSPINLSGGSTVFVTYPSEKSVNLDSSGNVTALGNVTSATWQGTTVGVAYGGTGVTASSGANSVVLRDSNQNVEFNNLFTGFTSITATGGTTVLTVASSYNQAIYGTGDHTIQLPDATTMPKGAAFLIDNDATGTVYINNGAGTQIELVPSGGIHYFFVESNSTIAGIWGRYAWIPANVEWGTNSLNLGGAIVSNGTWQGNTIQSGYGGTGLTTFTAADNALYSTSASTLTAGTLPVSAGGTGNTSFTSGHIPYGNGTSPLNSSSSLEFNGAYLVVGGTTPLSGATNPITAFSSTANNYVQTYTYNASSGTSASADFVAYGNNSADDHGWADVGFTSSNYNDAVYTVTGPNEAYIFGSAPLGAGKTGNLVYATDSTGSANAHQWYVGGFTQSKSAWKMQLTSTGLQLANALAVTYGGTGLTSLTAGYIPYGNGTSAFSSSANFTFNGTTLAVTGTSYLNGDLYVGASTGQEFSVLRDGTNAYLNARLTGGSLIFRTNGSTERMRITSNGGVSFGATGTAYGSSGQVLTSNGDAPPTWAAAPSSNITTYGLYENANTISANYTITTNNNAMSAGPLTINAGVTVTIPSGSNWVVL